MTPRQRRQKKVLITHKYRGSQQFSISKSVESNEELKVEQIFPKVISTTNTTLRTLNIYFIASLSKQPLAFIYVFFIILQTYPTTPTKYF